MRNFREIEAWEKSHLLVLDVYAATGGFSRDEIYGLTAQLRRCATSIPANIAEGCGRDGDAELRRFVLIAMGSPSELEYHLLLAHELGFLKSDTYRKLSLRTQEVKRMLSPFINKLRPPPKKLTS
jgi:four helix bundle protein